MVINQNKDYNPFIHSKAFCRWMHCTMFNKLLLWVCSRASCNPPSHKNVSRGLSNPLISISSDNEHVWFGDRADMLKV